MPCSDGDLVFCMLVGGGVGFYGCICSWQGCQKSRWGMWYDCHLGGCWLWLLRECGIFPECRGGLPFYGSVAPA